MSHDEIQSITPNSILTEIHDPNSYGVYQWMAGVAYCGNYLPTELQDQDLSTEPQYEMSYAEFIEPPSSIFEAIEKLNIKALKEFIARDRSVVDTRNTQGYTPLHHACRAVMFDMVKILVENGADLLALDACDMLPIHYACSYSDSEHALTAVAYIISLFSGNKKKKKLLVQMLNARNMSGQTCLHLAAMGFPCIEMVRLLLDNGALPIPDVGGFLPSYDCDDEEVKELLKMYENKCMKKKPKDHKSESSES